MIEPPQPTRESLDIYEATLTFRKKKDGSKHVTVHIRYSKSHSRKVRLPFPEDINSELSWVRYKGSKGDKVCSYHRISKDTYRTSHVAAKDMRDMDVYRELIPKLEQIVKEAYFQNQKKP